MHQLQICVLVFKCLHNTASWYLSDFFYPVSSLLSSHFCLHSLLPACYSFFISGLVLVRDILLLRVHAPLFKLPMILMLSKDNWKFLFLFLFKQALTLISLVFVGHEIFVTCAVCVLQYITLHMATCKYPCQTSGYHRVCPHDRYTAKNHWGLL